MKIVKFVRLALLFVAMLFAHHSYAACTYKGYTPFYVSYGNVIAQRDAAIGSVLAQYYAYGSGEYSICLDGGYEYYELSYNGGKSTSQSGVYATNVEGVGIKVQTAGGRLFTNPPGTVYIAGGSIGVLSSYYITLIKTGPVTSGTLMSGRIAREFNQDGSTGYEFIMSGYNTVTVVACSVSTPSLTFPIGNVLASKFGSSVGTIPAGAQNTQNLGLNCDANANINVTLSGTQNADVSDTSVLALTGQGSSDVASGVGVQLLYNNSPLKLNNRIVLKKSSGGQETFPLVARYYQTKSTVTTGKANASATLDLTYQ
ncbi:fimbrial protein [Cronobacter turicensis]